MKKKTTLKLSEKQKLDFIESVWGYVEVVEQRLAATGTLVYCVRNYASSLAVEFFTLSGIPGNPHATKKQERCSPSRTTAINRAFRVAKIQSKKKDASH